MDWDSVKQEAVNHLQTLIRINTTNPPGNEIEAIGYLSDVLRREGIEHQIFEPAPKRANLIARLPGTGDLKPLMLTSHVDVVPAERECWEHDPFGGEIHDGCIWGRGAVDMKQMTVMELMIFLMVRRSHLKLKRDLLLVAVADEEAGCEWGSRWLVANKPKLIEAEYALNEAGAFSLYVDDQVFYPIGVGERGVCWFKVRARGDPGHGSMPHDNQAVVKLAQAIHRLGLASLPLHSHPIVREFIHELARYQRPPKSWILKLLLVPHVSEWILKYLSPDKKRARSFHALLHNTVAPTVVQAGYKVNVIPASAEVAVDGRLMPGQTADDLMAEVKRVIGNEFEIETIGVWNPTVMDYDNSFFKMLKETLVQHDPQGIPVPVLMPGFSDASHYARLGIKCYGFSPVRLDKNLRFSEMFHGHNERIPVDGFLFGIKVMWDVVRNC